MYKGGEGGDIGQGGSGSTWRHRAGWLRLHMATSGRAAPAPHGDIGRGDNTHRNSRINDIGRRSYGPTWRHRAAQLRPHMATSGGASQIGQGVSGCILYQNLVSGVNFAIYVPHTRRPSRCPNTPHLLQSVINTNCAMHATEYIARYRATIAQALRLYTSSEDVQVFVMRIYFFNYFNNLGG